MPDLKSLISKTAIATELTRVRAIMRREDKEISTTPPPQGIQAGIGQTLDMMGTRILGRQNCSSGGTSKKATRHPTFRSCLDHEYAGRRKDFLVAGNQPARQRKQSQRLHRLPCIR